MKILAISPLKPKILQDVLSKGNNLVDAHVLFTLFWVAVTGLLSVCAFSEITPKELSVKLLYWDGVETAKAESCVMDGGFDSRLMELVNVSHAPHYRIVGGLTALDGVPFPRLNDPTYFLGKHREPIASAVAMCERSVRTPDLSFGELARDVGLFFCGGRAIAEHHQCMKLSDMQRRRLPVVLEDDRIRRIDDSIVINDQGRVRLARWSYPGSLTNNQGLLCGLRRAFCGFTGTVRGTPLPTSENSSQEQEGGSYSGPQKLFVLVGLIIALGGLVFLFKVLDYVYLKPGFNVDVAFGGLLLAAFIFWFGGWIVFHSLGLLSSDVRQPYNPHAVTGLRAVLGGSAWRATVSDAVVRRAGKSIDAALFDSYIRAGISLPLTESGPMRAGLIRINDLPEYGKIGIAISQLVDFRFSQGTRNFSIPDKSIGDSAVISGIHESSLHRIVVGLAGLKRWGFLAVIDLENKVDVRLIDDTFTDVDELNWHMRRWLIYVLQIIGPRDQRPYPSALLPLQSLAGNVSDGYIDKSRYTDKDRHYDFAHRGWRATVGGILYIISGISFCFGIWFFALGLHRSNLRQITFAILLVSFSSFAAWHGLDLMWIS
jgi:hypothetical protein